MNFENINFFLRWVQECEESMIMFDCVGVEFCNNQPQYASEGYDCYINNDLCEDFNGDGHPDLLSLAPWDQDRLYESSLYFLHYSYL